MKLRFYKVMSRIHYTCMMFLFWLCRVTKRDTLKSYAICQGLKSMKLQLKVTQAMREEWDV